MKKGSTVATKQGRKTSEQKLTVGLDVGDRSSWYCVLDESGAVVLEQRLSTSPKAMGEVLNKAKRFRYWCKRLFSVASNEGWLKPIRVQHRDDSFWLISL